MQKSVLIALAALVALSVIAAPASFAAEFASPPVFPLTHVSRDGSGEMADPQPIRRRAQPDGLQYISGTTRAIVSCHYPLRPQQCSWDPLTIATDGLQAAFRAAGVTVTNIQNVDLFQADDGLWHAAVTIGVSSAAHPQHWTVIAHAHPVDGRPVDAPPRDWQADTLLSGSLADPVDGNYDAKYYEEAGRLFLLFVVNTRPAPALRNAIALQPLASFERTSGPPHIILTPGDQFGELRSETFGDTPAKLVEAPWLENIGGKHALIYSTGSYLTPGYKAAVAWSDALVPPSGGHYRKVLVPMARRAEAGGPDVHYLLQSEYPEKPNFVGNTVVGPGVAAVTRGGGGGFWLIFNGFAPFDLPRGPEGRVDASRRRPYAVQLEVSIPPGLQVTGVSDAELAAWLTPIYQR